MAYSYVTFCSDAQDLGDSTLKTLQKDGFHALIIPGSTNAVFVGTNDVILYSAWSTVVLPRHETQQTALYLCSWIHFLQEREPKPKTNK